MPSWPESELTPATGRPIAASVGRPFPGALGQFLLPHRLLGAALCILVTVPIYRLLNHEQTGIAGRFTTEYVDIYYEFMWTGTLLVLVLAALAGRYLDPQLLEAGVERARRRLVGLRQPAFALGLALIAALITTAFTLILLDGKPNHIDSIAQLFHARWWTEGRIAGPASDFGGFWAIQNAVFTEHGWISQYPPGHVAVLALFLFAGIPWAVGPVLVGVAVVSFSLFADRLLPQARGTARMGSILLALSPFFLAVGGSFMNHITAAAGTCLGAYALVRAWQANPRWAFLAGFGFAYAFATRPLSSLAMSVALGLSLPFVVEKPTARRFAGIGLRAIVGALPVLLPLFAYNIHFSGGPLRSGYELALGPQMRLGFHRDPWANWYGIKEAIAYTSSDLISLSVNLFESPFPSLFILAAFLIWSRRIAPAVRALTFWAMAPVAANLFYWHHGLFMGPRMLHEAAPAWVLLIAVAITGLYNLIGSNRVLPGAVHARTSFTAALLISAVTSLLYLGPQRLASYGGQYLAITRVAVPQVDQPSLIFVHDAWRGRVAMQLVAFGMRLDESETAVRQNSTCRLQQLVDAHVAGDAARARQLRDGLDLTPRPNRLPQTIEIAPGDVAAVVRGEPIAPHCALQMYSDRNGVLDLSPLLWQGDAPGSGGRGAWFVRDLGPQRNAALISRYPERRPMVYALPAPRGDPELFSYDEGMRRLWGAK